MQSKRVYFGPKILRWLLPLGLGLLAAGLFVTTKNLEAYNRSPFPIPPAPRFNARVTLPNETSHLIDRAQVPVEFKLLRGETVADVFGKLGLEGVALRDATDALASKVDLHSLKAGNQYSAFFNPDSSLASFEMTLAGSGRVQMVREGGQWQSDWQPFERKVQLRGLKGTLDGSLEGSIRAAGGPSTLAYRMADIFQWDLDFARDLQRGDKFEVLYEEILLDGEFHAIGNVLALAWNSPSRRISSKRTSNLSPRCRSRAKSRSHWKMSAMR